MEPQAPDDAELPDDVRREITRVIEAGERIDTDEYLRRYPALGPELKRFVETRAGGAREAGFGVGAVIDDYRILREVGRGGMGVVYEAEQVSLGRKVALKVVTPAALRSKAAFDRFRRDADASGMMEGMDRFTEQAFGVLTSSRLMQALDIGLEDPAVRERYGKGDPKNRDDGGPKLMEHFLAARRLVEAGARCVTLAFSRWDHHGDNFGALRQDLPLLDQGLSALIEDLHHRGLDQDVSVVVWGEFGRTPKINPAGGRDHHPGVWTMLIGGGPIKGGVVVGASDELGYVPQTRPVTPAEVAATIYRGLGVDYHHELPGPQGRPIPLVDYGVEAIRELF